MALPDIQPALFDALGWAGDEMRHKMKLESFIDPDISMDLCNTGCIEKPELSKIIEMHSDFLWIHVPVSVGGWMAAAHKIEVVVVHPPYDEKEVKVVYGYNRNGEELTFDLWVAPEYPVFAITHESPPGLSMNPGVSKLKGRKAWDETRLYVYWWRFWGQHDGWPDYAPEFYTKCYIKNTDNGKKKMIYKEREDFKDVRIKCGDSCVNCDCDNVPGSGDSGYKIWGNTGAYVGRTTETYRVFYELQVWEDDNWPNSDDHIEDFDLGDVGLPDWGWYYGDVKSTKSPCPCPDDPYSGWKVDLYLKSVAF